MWNMCWQLWRSLTERMRKKRTKGWIGVLLTAKKRAGACLLAGALLMMPAGCSTAQEPSEVQSILVEGQELAWLRSMDRKYADKAPSAHEMFTGYG